MAVDICHPHISAWAGVNVRLADGGRLALRPACGVIKYGGVDWGLGEMLTLYQPRPSSSLKAEQDCDAKW